MFVLPLQLDEQSLASNPESPHSQEVEPVRKRRSHIPDKPNYSLNLWSIMKNCIGKELSKIPMPVRSMTVWDGTTAKSNAKTNLQMFSVHFQIHLHLSTPTLIPCITYFSPLPISLSLSVLCLPPVLLLLPRSTSTSPSPCSSACLKTWSTTSCWTRAPSARALRNRCATWRPSLCPQIGRASCRERV